MTIIEYGPDYPHPEGFVGLRVYVKKIGAPPYQEYFNFRGMNTTQINDLRSLAQYMDEIETQDQQQRKRNYLINHGSQCPLSCVLGINAGLVARHKAGGGLRFEFYISVTGVGPNVEVDRSGTVKRFTRTLTRFDYEWFVMAWRAACRVRAKMIGLARTPSQWFMGIASEKQVNRFIEKNKKKAFTKKTKGITMDERIHENLAGVPGRKLNEAVAAIDYKETSNH